MCGNNLKETILAKTNNGKAIFQFYIGKGVGNRKLFRNPLYDDRKASCSLFKGTDGIWRMKDFGDGGEFSGDAFWLVSELKHLDMKSQFVEIMKTIISDLCLPIDADSYLKSGRNCAVPAAVHETASSPVTATPEAADEPKEYDFKVREFTEKELEFWSQYGIGKDTLDFFGVHALESFDSVSAAGNRYSLKSTAKEPMYMYDRGSFIKLYRPCSKIRFMYAGKKATEDYIFGYERLPLKGDIVIITGGEKDVMSLHAHGFNAFCFNSETSNVLTEGFADVLRKRFKHIFVLYDMDATGRKASSEIVARYSSYSFKNLQLPLTGSKEEKDISDYFRMGYGASDLYKLINDNISYLYSETKRLLTTCELDFRRPPEMAENILTMKGFPVGVSGDLCCISGTEASGKSNFATALVAGTLCDLDEIITLGVKVRPNTDRKAVLLFDTEQSQYMLYKNLMRCLNRAGEDDFPSYFHALNLRTFPRAGRMKMLEESMDLYYHRHGGIHMVVIDGAADLISSVNNESESVALVESLSCMAAYYNTCIVCVLHHTPGQSKLRGHLGSELQRKSVGIVSLTPDRDPAYKDVSVSKVRDGSAAEIPAYRIGWSKEKEMHVYSGTIPAKDLRNNLNQYNNEQ